MTQVANSTPTVEEALRVALPILIRAYQTPECWGSADNNHHEVDVANMAKVALENKGT